MKAKPRSRSRTVSPTYANQKRYVNGIETHSHNTKMSSSDETMDDYVTPRFHERSAAGEVINNPMTYVKDTFKATGGGVFDVTQSGTQYLAQGQGSMTSFLAYLLGYPDGYYGSIPASDENLMTSAMHKAMGNLDRTPYSFGEDIGELGETLRFIRKPFHSVRDLAQDFAKDLSKHQRRKKIIDRAKAVADVWTEYQFAFLPLVRSVNDAIASFADKTNRPKRRTARGFSEFSKTESGLTPGAYVFAHTTKVEEHAHAGILYEVSNPIMDWRYKYGLRFKDIPETVWQLLPLSFMVDRMYNVSAALRGVASFLDPSVEILTGWNSRRKTITQTRSFVDYDYQTGVTAKNIQPDVDTKVNFEFTRGVWEPSIGDAMPVLDIPALVDSSTKIADLAAIVIQRLR